MLEHFVEWLKNTPVAIAFGVLLFVFSSLITITNGISLVKRYYSNTLGYKEGLIKNLQLLSAGVNINYLKTIFGQPCFVNKKEQRIEYIFVNKYYYLQAITNTDDKVLATSITTREPNFNPLISLGPYTTDRKTFNVELGKTTFFELEKNGFGKPTSVSGGIGNRRFFYGEEYYFGNPGNYQYYYFSLNDAGYIKYSEGDDWSLPLIDEQGKVKLENPKTENFRKNQIINTFTITDPLVNTNDVCFSGFAEDNSEKCFYLGPDLDQVRILKE